jgi:hypothetical protein
LRLIAVSLVCYGPRGAPRTPGAPPSAPWSTQYAIAATFDDFLDHGAEYLKHGRKNEAAVIANIVFEDTIRRIYRVVGMDQKGAP